MGSVCRTGSTQPTQRVTDAVATDVMDELKSILDAAKRGSYPMSAADLRVVKLAVSEIERVRNENRALRLDVKSLQARRTLGR